MRKSRLLTMAPAVIALCILVSSAAMAQTFVKLVDCLGECAPTDFILGSDGNLYGAGGIPEEGGVFKVTPSGAMTVLHKFNVTDGQYPNSPLVQASAGNFYGTTSQGGALSSGTIFRISLGGGTFTSLYSFCALPNCIDGVRPIAGLALGNDGNLYGTTYFGGRHNLGTIFRMTPDGTLTTLYDFYGQDGAHPNSPLVRDPNGNFWGTTAEGGANCEQQLECGTVFKTTPDGILTVMHSFGGADGGTPNSLVAAYGNFWGTTASGGDHDLGTVFKITPGGGLTSVHSFDGTDGSTPIRGLTPVFDGLHQTTHFYGTTWHSGAHNYGTIFKMATNGVVTTLHHFNHSDGTGGNGLIQLPNGNLYAAENGGVYGNGAIVVVSPVPYEFVRVTPCRLLDTRTNHQPIGGGTYQTLDLRNLAQQNGCAELITAASYSLNVTMVPVEQHAVGYLTIWPAGMSQPFVSTMNSLDGRIKANAAVVPAGANGKVNIYVTDTSDVVLDIDGYFTIPDPSQPTLQFYPLPPCRVADTRENRPYGLGSPHLSAGQERNLAILLSDCLPSGMIPGAYSFNFTAVPYPAGHPLGYLSVWPTLNKPPNPVSTLNNLTATNVANAAIVPAGYLGQVTVYASDDTDLVIDINGYYALPGNGGLALYPAAPCRVFDTRLDRDHQPLSGTLLPPLNVVNSGCGVPNVARAFGFNATVVPEPTLGYLTLWPNGQQQPYVSTLNASDGQIASNMAIVPSNDGFIEAFTYGTAHVILDIASYFAP